MITKMLRGMLALLACGLFAAPAAATVAGRPAAITYLDEDNNQRISVFTTEDGTGDLVENRFDGTSWNWIDHGPPGRGDRADFLSAITYLDSAGKHRIYVFALNSARKLVLRYWNGAEWKWVSQGGPELTGFPSAITYLDSAGNRQIYVFAVSTATGHLVLNRWDGSSWSWTDHGGGPDGIANIGSVEAITYTEEGQRRIEVYAVGRDGENIDKLVAHVHNGSSWTWIHQGGPGTNGLSVVTLVDSFGARRVYVFTRRRLTSLTQELWARLRVGSGASWINFGLPAGPTTQTIRFMSAIAYADETGVRRVHNFADIDGHLYDRYHSDLGPTGWANQGTAPGGAIQQVRAITYLDQRSATNRIYVFAISTANRHLLANYWNGSSWQWLDLGSP
jgi:hypothetical protein